MCKYCNIGKCENGENIIEIESDTGVYINRDSNDVYCLISNFDIVRERIITACPMCGRNLKEDKTNG